MTMGVRHSEAADRVALEVEFDHDHRLVAHDPTVVSRLDRHDLRSLVLHDTTVGVLDMDFAPREEADVGVHAEVSPDERLHVDRPAESGRVHHALDARRAGTSNLEPDAADFPAFGTSNRGDERINQVRLASNDLLSFRDDSLPDALLP